jgi:hypothetical protein
MLPAQCSMVGVRYLVAVGESESGKWQRQQRSLLDGAPLSHAPDCSKHTVS